MSKLLVVFGATGQQGGSVINAVLNDQELSQQYKLRAITRDPSKPAALALKDLNVEVVQATLQDPKSLRAAIQGAHTVFLVTVTVYDEQLVERDVTDGKAIADAAVAAGAQYIIYSTAVPALELSGRRMDVFDSKAVVEAYIRTLPVKSAFYAPGVFMQNFESRMAPHPTAKPGVFAISNIIQPDTLLPLIDAAADTGKFIGAVLTEPERYEGKVLWAATGLWSMKQVAEAIGKVSGKEVTYEQLDEETFRTFMPPVPAGYTVDMMRFIQDPGYYGKETRERVDWTKKQTRGSLTSLQEFLETHPLKLE